MVEPKRDLYAETEAPLTKVFDSLVVEVCTIDAETAARWLDANHKNRPLRTRGSDAYGRDVEKGRWVITGDTIKFDWFGRLFDGQHRLTAVVKSGKPLTSLVVWGVDPEARKYTDTGMARQYRDVLKMDEVPNAEVLAPAVRRAFLWDPPINERVNFGRAKVTHAEEDEVLARHPELHYCAKFVVDLPLNGIKISRSLLAFVYWVLLFANADEAREFITKVGSGANLPDNDPILRLRGWVSDYGRRGREFEADFVWRAVVAWNAWMEGRTLKKIQLPKGGMRQDNFPVLRTRRKTARED